MQQIKLHIRGSKIYSRCYTKSFFFLALDSQSLTLEFNTLWISQETEPDKFATAAQKHATHSDIRWQSPQSPWPRVCPGKMGDTSGSQLPLCDAGRNKPRPRVPLPHTHWRDRYTYT